MEFNDMPAKDPKRLTPDERELRDNIQKMFEAIPEVVKMTPRSIPENDIVVSVPLGQLRQIMTLALEQLMEKEMTL